MLKRYDITLCWRLDLLRGERTLLTEVVEKEDAKLAVLAATLRGVRVPGVMVVLKGLFVVMGRGLVGVA